MQLLLLLLLVVFAAAAASSSACNTLERPFTAFHPNHLNFPTLLRKYATNWSAPKLWTRHFLQHTLRNISFPQGSLQHVLNNSDHYIFTKISPTTGQLMTEPPHQSTFTPLSYTDHLPLFDSWHDPDKTQQSVAQFLIIGGNGSGLSFHTHLNGAWNALIAGEKQWFLFPPKLDTLTLDPMGFPSWWTDETTQGRQRFATTIQHRLHRPPVECIQEVGDVLFVPSGWAHMVISYGAINVAINAIHETRKKFTNHIDL